jgi:homoserine dehydrogenase
MPAAIRERRHAGEVRVGIIGYGTVGRATAEILATHAREIGQRTDGVAIRVTRLCRHFPEEGERGVNLIRLDSDWKRVVYADDVDLIVETVGGTGAAYEIVRASLEAGKPVVTANKALIARYGDELFAIARARHVPIGMEASVGGGVPVIRALSEALAADRIQAVYGILNGTANFILTQMEHSGVEFSHALQQAQQAGYAEADPSLDIDGLDARDKIAILARLAFHSAVELEHIPVTGIRQVTATDFHYARRLDTTIRLVAAAERSAHGIHISVRPWLVQHDSMLAKVDGPNNAIFIVGEKVGTQMLYGRGAGGGATGTAVLSDVIQIAKQLGHGQPARNGITGFHDCQTIKIDERSRPVSWYLRLTVADRPGILVQVCEAIAAQQINIDSVIQEPHMRKEKLSFVVTLEPVSEPVVLNAVAVINQFPFMLEPVFLAPITSSAG